MNFDCIVSQVHIPDYDVQGDWTAGYKREMVEFAIKHLRQFNKNSYIVVTGHGLRPRNLDLCDWSYWADACEPLNEHGYVIGMPAQFVYVSKGIEHLKEQGFRRCVKTRGDCVIGKENIAAYCDEIINNENKQLLITQQTGFERLGDCFLYGDIELLSKTWHSSNKVHHSDGLQNTAINFRAAVNDYGPWLDLVSKHCAFRDVHKLAFTCLRWNKVSEDVYNAMLDPGFDFTPYHWGRANNWHIFDGNGNMTGTGAELYWSEKQFYELINS